MAEDFDLGFLKHGGLVGLRLDEMLDSVRVIRHSPEGKVNGFALSVVSLVNRFFEIFSRESGQDFKHWEQRFVIENVYDFLLFTLSHEADENRLFLRLNSSDGKVLGVVDGRECASRLQLGQFDNLAFEYVRRNTVIVLQFIQVLDLFFLLVFELLLCCGTQLVDCHPGLRWFGSWHKWCLLFVLFLFLRIL